MMMAHDIGMWNSKLRATALPSDSAKSVAPMAISIVIQLGQRAHFGYQSRQHWAKSLPVATPNRADITCRIRAIKLASAMTQSSPYLNRAPPARSVPQLPGSM